MADAMFEPADFLEESLPGPPRSSPVRVAVERHRGRPRRRRAGTPRSTAATGSRSTQDRPAESPAPLRALELVAAARTATRDGGLRRRGRGARRPGHERRAARRALRLRPRPAPGQAPGRRTRQGPGPPGHQGRHRRRRPDGQPARAAVRPRLEVPVVHDRPRRGARRQGRRLRPRRGRQAARQAPDRRRTRRTASRPWSPARRARTASPTPTSSSRPSSRRCRSSSRSSPRSRRSCRAECVLATNTSSLSITEMAAELRAPRAGRRLPLLQPGRRHAAARDHPGRADRRRHSRNGFRHRARP